VDYNQDGKMDLVIGDGWGVIHIFLNAGTDDFPELVAPITLQLNGADCFLGERAKHEFTDWNNDGKQDLIVGTENGEIFLMINSGTNTEPLYQNANPLPLGDYQLALGARVQPCVYDYNRDGKKDVLLADEFCQLHYYENIGSDHTPEFTTGQIIDLGIEKFPTFSRGRLEITDWNNDDIPDILFGYMKTDEEMGYLYLFLGENR